MWQTSDIGRRIEHAIVYWMVYARDCNLNNNGVIHPETICASAKWPSFPSLYYVEGIQVKKTSQRQAPVVKTGQQPSVECGSDLKS